MSETENGAPIAETRALVAAYDEQPVLDGIDLAVTPGEIFFIVGASGCGKSTLLKHMCGLLAPVSGSVILEGRDLTELDEDELAAQQRRMGIAFQSAALFNDLTLAENVALPLQVHTDLAPALIAAAVRIKLSLVGLADATDRKPAELSGGMRKRAGLARALALDPPLVFFDEPSAGLDPGRAAGLDELIAGLRGLLGTTFVVVSHEIASIERLADRLVMLEDGKVIFTGTPAQARAAGPETARAFFARRPGAA